MVSIEQARDILEKVGMPAKQRTDICCLTFLAMANLRPTDEWSDATGEWNRIHDMLQFASQNWGKDYAENSRETLRKQALHPFRDAAIVEDNGKATNSPNYCYRLTVEALTLIKSYGSAAWEQTLAAFLAAHEALVDLYASRKAMTKMPVRINNVDLTLSVGEHNALQKAIIEEFAPRFAPGAQCLYLGDSTERDLVKDTEKLKELGFEITLHDTMPDVVLYREDTDWLYFVEAVTSVGPMSPKRIREINKMTQNVTSGKIFVTAFPNFKTYKKFSEELAWETEVWLAEMPDHMIHLNGDKFMGPRTSR